MSTHTHTHTHIDRHIAIKAVSSVPFVIRQQFPLKIIIHLAVL